MATSEDQQIRNAILQLLEEYSNTGQIDLQNLPLLQQIIQQQVEQRLPLLTQERTQYLNKLYAQEFKKICSGIKYWLSKNWKPCSTNRNSCIPALICWRESAKNCNSSLI